MNLIAGKCFETGNYKDDNVDFDHVNDAAECQKLCQENSQCNFWTFGTPDYCWLQTENDILDTCATCIRGPRFCSSKPGIDTWKQIGDKIYKVGKEEKSFDDAVSQCKLIGGKLFEPKTEKENNDVIEFFEPLFEDSTSLSFWLGIYDKDNLGQEGEFRYKSDEGKLTYENWRSGEPNNLEKEHCASVDIHENGRWNDITCDNEIPFICERVGM